MFMERGKQRKQTLSKYGMMPDNNKQGGFTHESYT